MPPMTPEEAEGLVALHGGEAPAARAIGVPRQTLQYWLNPRPGRARSRRLYHSNPEAHREKSARYYEKNAFAIQQRMTFYRAEKALERARQKAEEHA